MVDTANSRLDGTSSAFLVRESTRDPTVCTTHTYPLTRVRTWLLLLLLLLLLEGYGEKQKRGDAFPFVTALAGDPMDKA
jgi:hypothetical protein